VRRAVAARRPLSNFDLQVRTREGRRWCNVSVLAADDASVETPYAVYVLRLIDVRKRLETLVRDFVVNETGMPAEQAVALLRSTRAPARDTDLTAREMEILRQLAKGRATAEIAERLHVSRTTVNNHVQHILRKLGAHTRLEAIRRAEHAGLL
jgi:DNA-binding NarL/FixJ family response regulator